MSDTPQAASLNWVKIADTVSNLSFGSNGIAAAEAAGKKLCVAKYKEELFAFAYTCPHAGGLLIDGYMDALGNVVCPLHRYKFCLKNGRNVTGEGYYLKRWPVKIEQDGVYVWLKPEGFIGLQ